MFKPNIPIAKKEKRYEIEAAQKYTEDIQKATDPKLIKILQHNREDEIEDHAKKLGKYVKKYA